MPDREGGTEAVPKRSAAQQLEATAACAFLTFPLAFLTFFFAFFLAPLLFAFFSFALAFDSAVCALSSCACADLQAALGPVGGGVVTTWTVKVQAYMKAGVATRRILVKLPEFEADLRSDLALRHAIGFTHYDKLPALLQ